MSIQLRLRVLQELSCCGRRRWERESEPERGVWSLPSSLKGNHFQSHDSLLLLLWDKASTIATHLTYPETRPLLEEELEKIVPLINSWHLYKNNFLKVVRQRITASTFSGRTSTCKQRASNSGSKFDGQCCLKGLHFSHCSLLRLPAEAICLKDSNIFAKNETFTLPKT